ncbi:hypothetical protein BKA01_008333 [Pseudonocardia eucalypti]|uniref:hypothetical protein n=1 Tax=Pseudonocardia eucalypti TaxID=648755 RepID=UPI00160C4729|nr:hypothetical protein [Pseudonocardia eucalypti]
MQNEIDMASYEADSSNQTHARSCRVTLSSVLLSATHRNTYSGVTMRLTFLGKESVPDQSPTLYATDSDSYVVQGWIVTDPKILAVIPVAEDETVVEVPPKLMVHLANDGPEGDVVNLIPPIVHVNEVGNYIVRGTKVTDQETLSQMDIPGHETCVHVSRVAMAALVGS